MSNPTFTEWLFSIVPTLSGDEDDIVKKFSKANAQQLGWPINASSQEELILFFTEEVISEAANIGVSLNRGMQNRDFDDFMRLLAGYHQRITANYKSSVFALRTAWKDYEAYLEKNKA